MQRTQPAGATGSKPGGATGSKPGGATGSKPGGATGSQKGDVKVKKESDCESTGNHSHHFTVKFDRDDCKECSIHCDEPRTVLDVIKSTEEFKKKMKKHPDENFLIQLGKEDREFTVATHFPCSCISDGESLIISCDSEKVEEVPNPNFKIIYPRENYSVFFIDKEGGRHTKTKKLFRNKAVKQFKYLCVYGEKGITVEEALRQDGRFIDLSNFLLSDNDSSNLFTEHTQKVDKLDKKKFKIKLPRGKGANDQSQKENPGASTDAQTKRNTRSVSNIVHQAGVSVKAAMAKSGSGVDNTEEIYDKLREQFPALKELMESRFPGDSYQQKLNLRQEDFGKIQQSFSEVHRVKKLLKLGESVCKVVVENECQGTGFVLFDKFILTNAHLFKNCVEGENLRQDTDVFFIFNYEEPVLHTNWYSYKLAQSHICYMDDELDYAVLELKPEGQTKVPPGLLKKFSPLPQSGEACIIGHPAGQVKKIDPTCIIEIEKRGQAVNDYLHQYKDTIFTIYSISELIKQQGIEKILMGGNKADKVGTYNTFMYHGSSGSPVFDAHCRVFGLHTAGFTSGFKNQEDSVIEYAQPLLTIFEHFVKKLKERRDDELLKKIEKEAKGNLDLEKVLAKLVKAGAPNPDKSVDSDESMDTS